MPRLSHTLSATLSLAGTPGGIGHLEEESDFVVDFSKVEQPANSGMGA